MTNDDFYETQARLDGSKRRIAEGKKAAENELKRLSAVLARDTASEEATKELGRVCERFGIEFERDETFERRKEKLRKHQKSMRDKLESFEKREREEESARKTELTENAFKMRLQKEEMEAKLKKMQQDHRIAIDACEQGRMTEEGQRSARITDASWGPERASWSDGWRMQGKKGSSWECKSWREEEKMEGELPPGVQGMMRDAGLDASWQPWMKWERDKTGKQMVACEPCGKFLSSEHLGAEQHELNVAKFYGQTTKPEKQARPASTDAPRLSERQAEGALLVKSRSHQTDRARLTQSAEPCPKEQKTQVGLFYQKMAASEAEQRRVIGDYRSGGRRRDRSRSPREGGGRRHR